MPLITPPNDNGIEIEVFVEEQIEFTEDHYNRIKEYMIKYKPWMCICGLKNFWANKKCASFKCKLDKPK